MKVLVALFAVLVWVVAGGTAHAAVLAKPPNNLGLLGYWSFNEGAGATAGDYSNRGNTGTVANTTWGYGKSGKALQFNGSDAYVDVGDLQGPSGEITISAWIKRTGDQPWASILDRYGGESLDCFSLGLDSESGNKLMFMWNNVEPFGDRVVADSVLPLNEWVHVAASSDGANVTFYVNGVADGTQTAGAPCTTGNVYIGVNPAGGDEYFGGSIDEVRLYGRALSADEIQNLYQYSPLGGRTSLTSLGSGLRGDYYDGINFDTLVGTYTDPTVDFNPADTTLGTNRAGGGDTFSVRWTGYVRPAFSETYTFYTSADDGIRLWVNNTQLINDWTEHGVQEQSGSIALQAGQYYPVTLEFYENGGGAAVWFSWSSASVSKEIIPAANLFSGSVTVVQANTSSATLQGGGSLGQGLVGLWTFDGADFGSTVADRSGQGNNGYVIGAATSSVKGIGKFGQALYLDGADDQVLVPSASSLNPGTSDFAISAWVKSSNMESGDAIMLKTNGGSEGASYGFHYGTFNTRQPTMHFSSGAAFTQIQSASSLTLDEWNHVVISVDRDTMANTKVYINGVVTTTNVTNPTSNTGSLSNTVPLSIGAESDGGFLWQGQIDDVRYYMRTLSAEEVTQLYNLGR